MICKPHFNVLLLSSFASFFFSNTKIDQNEAILSLFYWDESKKKKLKAKGQEMILRKNRLKLNSFTNSISKLLQAWRPTFALASGNPGNRSNRKSRNSPRQPTASSVVHSEQTPARWSSYHCYHFSFVIFLFSFSRQTRNCESSKTYSNSIIFLLCACRRFLYC